MEFGDFILEHEADDLGRLALARDRFLPAMPEFDLALTTLEVRRKLRLKVPEWYAVPGLRYPLRLSGEQCSSSETARYKAQVAAGLAGTGRGRLADLTGGLGVDTWAFAQVFDRVLYNEMRPELAAAAQANFAALGLENVTVQCRELVPGGVASVLGDFRPTVLYLDPARRSSDGHKVFRLEDCQPAVLALLPELFAACPRVLLKLSPMADISLVCRQLGSVRAVHIVAAEGECKELLLVLERGYAGEPVRYVYESGTVMEIPGPAPESVAPLCCSTMNLAGSLLFEPGKGLLKAAAFDLPCGYGLEKLGRHTHLYVGASVPEALLPFGKCFEVLEAVPFSNRALKDLGRRYPQAEVTARNLPLTSDQLRARLGCRSGGSVHLFGVHIDALQGNYLLVSRPL